MKEYLTVSQKETHTELNRRQDDGTWVMRDIDSLEDRIILESIHCEVSMRDLYEKVTFATE